MGATIEYFHLEGWSKASPSWNPSLGLSSSRDKVFCFSHLTVLMHAFDNGRSSLHICRLPLPKDGEYMTLGWFSQGVAPYIVSTLRVLEMVRSFGGLCIPTNSRLIVAVVPRFSCIVVSGLGRRIDRGCKASTDNQPDLLQNGPSLKAFLICVK